jgi:hypothetical protein
MSGSEHTLSVRRFLEVSARGSIGFLNQQTHKAVFDLEKIGGLVTYRLARNARLEQIGSNRQGVHMLCFVLWSGSDERIEEARNWWNNLR